LTDYENQKLKFLKTHVLGAFLTSTTTISNQLAIKEILQGDALQTGNGSLDNTRTFEYFLSRDKDIVTIDCTLQNDIPESVITNIISTFKFTR